MNAQTANTDVLPDAALKKLREVGLSIEHIEPSPVKRYLYRHFKRGRELRQQRWRLHFHRELVSCERERCGEHN
nr:hypothetical protein [Escherichia coli]